MMSKPDHEHTKYTPHARQGLSFVSIFGKNDRAITIMDNITIVIKVTKKLYLISIMNTPRPSHLAIWSNSV